MTQRGLVAGVVAAAVIATVWVVPRELDWNQFKGQITALAAARLGRPVAIAGDVRLTILPQPVLTARQISVTDPVTGGVFTAREMQLRVELFGLLVGRIDPEALDLDQAVLKLPWPLAAGGFRMRPPTAFAATMHNGTLLVGNAVVSSIDATLATYGDDGAVNVFGTARIAAEDWGFEGNLGAIDEDHESVVSAIFTGEGATDGAMLRLTGELRDDGSLSGDLAASGPDLSRILAAPAVPFGAEAKIQAAGNVLTGSDLALEMGGIDGKGSFRWQAGDPGFSLKLATTRLDLDRWAGVWLRPDAGAGSSRFAITADAAQLQGGMLRDLHIDLERGRGLILHDFTATLPGETAFSAHGSGSVTGGDWRIDQGGFSLKGGDITPSWSWLAAADPDLPALPGWSRIAADLHGEVTGELGGAARSVSLTGLQGTLANSGINGRIWFTRGERTQVSADLAVDQLALDPLAALRVSPKLDYDVTMAAKSASFDAVTAQDVGFRLVRDQSGARLSGGRGTILGASFTASATTAADGTVNDASIDAKETSLAPLLPLLLPGWQGTPALAALPAQLQATFKGPLRALTGTVTVDAGQTELRLWPTIDWPDRTAAGALTLHDPGAWRLVSLLGGPDIAPWVEVGSLGLIARWNAKPGHLGVDYLDLAFGGMRVSGGLVFDHGGNGRWALNGQLHSSRLPVAWPKLAGDFSIPTAWAMGGSGTIDLSADELVYQDSPIGSAAHANLTLADGVVTLGDVTATVGMGSIAGNAAWHLLDPVPNMLVSGNFNDVAANGPVTGGPLDFLAGSVSGKLNLAASGHTPATMLATLGGDVDLAVTNAMVSGFDLMKAAAASSLPGTLKPQAALTAALTAGTSSFDQLQMAAKIEDGGLSVSGSLTGMNDADVSGFADLPSGAMNLGLVLQLGAAPPVEARYKGPFNAPAMTVDMAGFKKWLLQRSKARVSRARKK